MGGIQPHSMESIWNVFWLVTQPFFHSIPAMESMEFPMTLYYKSMYYSIWIPWNSHHRILWKNPWNGLSIILPTLEIKPSTLSMDHVCKHKDILAAGLLRISKDIKLPLLNCALDWPCPKQMSAIANAWFRHHQQSTWLFLNHHHHPQSSPNDTNNTVTMCNIVTLHSKSSPSVPLNPHSRCHVAVSNVATRRWAMDSSFIINWWALQSNPTNPT